MKALPHALLFPAMLFAMAGGCLAQEADAEGDGKIKQDEDVDVVAVDKNGKITAMLESIPVAAANVYGQPLFVNLKKVAAMALFEYTVDGEAYREMAIDTMGRDILRIYSCIDKDAEDARNTAKEAAGKNNRDLKIPAKAYPKSTHKCNVEFLCDVPDKLENVFYRGLVSDFGSGNQVDANGPNKTSTKLIKPPSICKCSWEFIDHVFEEKQSAVAAVKSQHMWCGKIYGHYLFVKVPHITSVSKQAYTVNGEAYDEVTVDTDGSSTIRFYTCINEASRKARQTAAKSMEKFDAQDAGAGKVPARVYPQTTHSHNIEFQIPDAKVLDKIFNSLSGALIDGEYRISTYQ